jgi:hypothetical protein
VQTTSDPRGEGSILEALNSAVRELHARIDSVNASVFAAVQDAQVAARSSLEDVQVAARSGLAEVSSQIESGLASLQEAEGPKDLYLFVKNYDWSLRYRVRHIDAALDLEHPLELQWVKLRKAPTNPSEVLGDAESLDLFDWENTAPAGHKGFMYEVTKAVGSGVEAVINFFKGRGVNLIVQADGISLAPEAPSLSDPSASQEGKPRPVTTCWVDVSGLPLFPSVKTINFFNSQETVLAWQA